MGPVARLLPDGKRLHLQHGPSDLIVFADGAREAAYEAATARFETIIAEVVEELRDLRRMIGPKTPPPTGQVARRMHDAAMPFVTDAPLTRMAAVAGAIADEVLAAMVAGADLRRAYVNNGGDIALYLAPGARFRTAISGHDGAPLGEIDIASGDCVGGIATSGRHGRSLSFGIADSVTVLARDAATADVAATLCANAVDLPGHPGIARRPARDVVDDSDLGDLPVVVRCDPLAPAERAAALARGQDCAMRFRSDHRIISAALFLQGQATTTNDRLMPVTREAQYA